MARGVKKFRIRLKSDDRVGLKASIGHRLDPDGMRMRHDRPPPVDTPVEIQLVYADGRLALKGAGWVSAVESGEVHLELEWSDGDDPELSVWLFGQAEAPGLRTVTLDELESPDEVPLVPSEAPSSSGQRVHPDMVWELSRPVPAVSESAAEVPTEPIDLTESLPPDPQDESTPIALTDVVEQAQAALDEAGELETDRHRASGRLADLRAEARADGVAPSSGRADSSGGSEGPASGDEDPWRGTSAITSRFAEGPPPLPGRRGSEEGRQVTPLARIELAKRESSAVLPARRGSEAVASEPGEVPSVAGPPPLESPVGPLLAFDIGTSMTAAAVAEEGASPRLLPAEQDDPLLPSVVVIEPDRVIAGTPALRSMSRRPGRGVIGTKRLLGRSYWSPVVRRIEGQLPFRVVPGPRGEVAAESEGRTLALEEVAAVLLRRAARNARADLGIPANRAILTCPAYYGARQRAALALSGRLAGLHVPRVVSCSVAAAVHYAPELGEGRNRLLVFDLGAGTLDVSVVEVEGGRFRTLAAGGHALLGGIDFDAAVAQLLVVALEGAGRSARSGSQGVSEVLDAAEGGKHALGETSRVQLPVSAEAAAEAAEGMSVEVARDDAEALWATLVDKALSVARDVCRRAHVAPSDLDEVLVTGGQARAPYVRRRLEEFFQQPCVDLAPGAVVLGAAELGRRLDGQEAGFSVHETSPCSFGYGAPGGAFVPVAHRDARLPVSGEAFIDLPPGAPPELLLFEGDHGRVEGCEPYARLRLDEVPEGREDTLRLQLNLRLDDRGTLALEVLRAATGTSVPHRLDPALSDEQVARSLAAPAEAAPEEPTEVGFLDWLKKKLRPL